MPICMARPVNIASCARNQPIQYSKLAKTIMAEYEITKSRQIGLSMLVFYRNWQIALVIVIVRTLFVTEISYNKRNNALNLSSQLFLASDTMRGSKSVGTTSKGSSIIESRGGDSPGTFISSLRRHSGVRDRPDLGR